MSKKMITLTGNNGLRWRAVITPAGIRRAQSPVSCREPLIYVAP